MKDKNSKTSCITIEVSMDENKLPSKIRWKADDGPGEKQWKESKAFTLSFFDKKFKDTYKIDLWTKDMQVTEMDRFIYNTLKGIADSYFRSTQNSKLANAMQGFIEHFGKETKIL